DGSCAASHVYASAGVYTVGVAVTDDDTGSARATFQYVVVFDPNGGFVTGGGWIASPAGASLPEPAWAGKGTFGFVAKYFPGTMVPSGETHFSFGKSRFQSTSYEWLVVTGDKAEYAGRGALNGVAGYE